MRWAGKNLKTLSRIVAMISLMSATTSIALILTLLGASIRENYQSVVENEVFEAAGVFQKSFDGVNESLAAIIQSMAQNKIIRQAIEQSDPEAATRELFKPSLQGRKLPSNLIYLNRGDELVWASTILKRLDEDVWDFVARVESLPENQVVSIIDFQSGEDRALYLVYSAPVYGVSTLDQIGVVRAAILLQPPSSLLNDAISESAIDCLTILYQGDTWVGTGDEACQDITPDEIDDQSTLVLSADKNDETYDYIFTRAASSRHLSLQDLEFIVGKETTTPLIFRRHFWITSILVIIAQAAVVIITAGLTRLLVRDEVGRLLTHVASNDADSLSSAEFYVQEFETVAEAFSRARSYIVRQGQETVAFVEDVDEVMEQAIDGNFDVRIRNKHPQYHDLCEKLNQLLEHTAGVIEVERMKSDFVGVVSHELRTPLASIRGSLGLMQGAMRNELPERAHKMVEIAQRNSDRLIVLINNILDSAQIRQGQLKLDFSTFNIQEQLTHVVDSSAMIKLEREADIKLMDVDPDVVIHADVVRFGQVISNLVSNAIKYSPEPEPVTIKGEFRNNKRRYRLNVIDKGYGISRGLQHRLFTLFWQEDGSRTRVEPGTGLGLFVTRELVVNMHGEIGFQSEEGVGSCFWVEFECDIMT